MDPNFLYYGNNLEVLRRHVKDESVDLVYLDPPFNSNADYNVLFAEHGTKAAAQIQAFDDTWHWDAEAAAAYQETVEVGGRFRCHYGGGSLATRPGSGGKRRKGESRQIGNVPY